MATFKLTQHQHDMLEDDMVISGLLAEYTSHNDPEAPDAQFLEKELVGGNLEITATEFLRDWVRDSWIERLTFGGMAADNADGSMSGSREMATAKSILRKLNEALAE
jgi:hypothetical protein